jgi:hypothetical protein
MKKLQTVVEKKKMVSTNNKELDIELTCEIGLLVNFTHFPHWFDYWNG